VSTGCSRRRKREHAGGLEAQVVVPDALGDLADEVETFEHVRRTVRGEECPCGHDLEVQVRSRRVPAGADQSQHLAPTHPLTCVHPNGARLQVCVEQEHPRSDSLHDMVPHRFPDWRWGWQVGRLVVGQAIEDVNDCSIGGGDDRVAIAEIAAELRRVANPRTMLIIEPEPVDGEALSYRQIAIHREQPAAVMPVIAAAALTGEPDALADRRTEHDGGLSIRLDAGDHNIQ
jgi:hypothetical protein